MRKMRVGHVGGRTGYARLFKMVREGRRISEELQTWEGADRNGIKN